MSYPSVDKLQQTLQHSVFNHTQDPKKAAGRALGTLIEIVTYYLLKSWGFTDSIGIERSVPEYGNPEISHNIEYSLHPIKSKGILIYDERSGMFSANSIFKRLAAQTEVNIGSLSDFVKTGNKVLSGGIVRNACVLGVKEETLITANFSEREDAIELSIIEQLKTPYAIFECKRVGVQEGLKKGPQSIEKAKQGAYVAKSVSAMQKVRSSDGQLMGILYSGDEVILKPYDELLATVIASDKKLLLNKFILTVGVVSNHGNWFTAENQNKELKVLAQSYDWLLFLTDRGLAEFIDVMLLNPEPKHEILRETFLSSYAKGKTKNQFTKVQMNLEADEALRLFFKTNLSRIEGWFNVISPRGQDIISLKNQLENLGKKDWFNLI